jgi:archaellum component FlaC
MPFDNLSHSATAVLERLKEAVATKQDVYAEVTRAQNRLEAHIESAKNEILRELRAELRELQKIEGRLP